MLSHLTYFKMIFYLLFRINAICKDNDASYDMLIVKYLAPLMF